LHVGTGYGYVTAILARLSTRVYGVERYKTLVETAEPLLHKYAPNAVIRHGNGNLGWRGQAPFDRILISAAVRAVPNALLGQLKPDGQILAVVGNMLTIAQRKGTKFKETQILELSLPPLEPGKARAL